MPIKLEERPPATAVLSGAGGTDESSIYGVNHIDTLMLQLDGTGDIDIKTSMLEDGTFTTVDTITNAEPVRSIDIRSNCVKFVVSSGSDLTLYAQGARINKF